MAYLPNGGPAALRQQPDRRLLCSVFLGQSAISIIGMLRTSGCSLHHQVSPTSHSASPLSTQNQATTFSLSTSAQSQALVTRAVVLCCSKHQDTVSPLQSPPLQVCSCLCGHQTGWSHSQAGLQAGPLCQIRVCLARWAPTTQAQELRSAAHVK